MHLPIAPKCNIQCKYCNRKYDCANESRPGVTNDVLTPNEAINYVRNAMQARPDISVIGVAGPGDPMANPEKVIQTLSAVRNEFPEKIICLSTNGLNLAPYIDDLEKLQVSHVTLTINGCDPKVLQNVYQWVRPEKKSYRGIEGATILMNKQFEALDLLRDKAMMVKVNTVAIPGVNMDHIPELVEALKDYDVERYNLLGLIPVEDTPFENLQSPSEEEINELRDLAGRSIPIMAHCQRCRADAAGLLGKDDENLAKLMNEAASPSAALTSKRPYIAIASQEGFLINQHLGEADELIIIDPRNGAIKTMAPVQSPPRGLGDERWKIMAADLRECGLLLCSGVGPNPFRILENSGIKVIETQGLIDDIATRLSQGRSIPSKPRSAFSCGSECGGNGQGCA
jgi:nitrogen fixation protein NifB